MVYGGSGVGFRVQGFSVGFTGFKGFSGLIYMVYRSK